MAKESRFADIYRQELKKNRGIMGAFATTGGARAKEILDLRQYLLPQMGVTGAISQRLFGKPFRYGSGTGGVRTVGGGTTGMVDKSSNEKLTRIDINSKITAKNSVVLPAMARDMNLMRMNMQKMVKLSGGTPARKADMFFKRAGERESAYESQFKKSGGTGGLGIPGSPLSSVSGGIGSVLGGVIGGIGSVLGGVIGGIGSVFSGITSFFGNIGGGLLRGLGSIFSGMGIWGILLLSGVGLLISELFRNVDFTEIGNSFKGIGTALKDLFTGKGSDEKGLIESTKENWNSLVDAVDKTKNEFLNMAESIKSQASNLKQLFDGLGGTEGVLGILFGSAIVARFAAGLLTTPYGALAALVLALVGKAAYDLLKIPKDERPLSNKEQFEAGQSAQGGGFKSAAVLAGERRKAAKDEQKINEIDKELFELRVEEENLKRKPRTTVIIGDLKRNALRAQELEKRKSELIIKKKQADQDARELTREGPRSSSPFRYTEAMMEADNPAASPEKVGDISNKKFSDLTTEEQNQLLMRQAIAEGFTNANSIQHSHNNPGNIIVDPKTGKPFPQDQALGGITGGTYKGHTFVKYPTMEAGWAAMRKLWETPTYSNIPITEALSKWAPDLNSGYRSIVLGKSGANNTIPKELAASRSLSQKQLASAPKTPPPAPTAAQDKEMSLMEAMGTMFTSLMQQTSESLSSVASNISQANQQQLTNIESPYDKELYEDMIGFHSSIVRS